MEGHIGLHNIVSIEDIRLISKLANIELLDELPLEKRAEVIDNDREKDYYRYSVLEVGKFPDITPTLIFQDCYPNYGSRHTQYAVNLKTGKPTAKSPNKTVLPQDLRERLCNQTKNYLDYLKHLNPKLVRAT
jgi:hypothetical protein